MKKIYLTRIIVTLLVVLSLIFSATSCELLAEYGINIDEIIGSSDNDKQQDTVDGDKANTDTNGDKSDGTNTDKGDGQKPTPDPTPIPDDNNSVTVYLPNEVDPVTSDPYVNVDVDEFYKNYEPAISYMDAYYRTQHNLMSGSISIQTATPYVSSYQPEKDGKLVRNTAYIFSEDGKTYYVVDAYGNIVNKIYKCGAYVTLDEVAAFVFAFGTFPANHTTEKKPKPASSPWGKYLRANHSHFTGDTSRYPYEPELPNIDGCGGELYYYEMDVGTAAYNNGTNITRGSCRIVYTRSDLDRDGVIEIDETYLFYTQNHYHDFREYLNYLGGWGTVFGDEAGGGISVPTPYEQTSYYSFVLSDGSPLVKITAVAVVWIPKREEA